MPDLKALIGDPSDDIPGVSGIGVKTAASLLRSFPTVEQIIEHLEVVSAAIRRRLEPARDRVVLNKQLALLAPVRLRRPGGSLRVAAPRKALLGRLAHETGVQSIAR